MITKITLDNFKCFDKAAFNFRNLTILAGGNGSGKSSVIQSLLLLRQSYVDKTARETSKMLFKGDYTNLLSAISIPNFHCNREETSISIEKNNGAALTYTMNDLRDDAPESDVVIDGSVKSYEENCSLYANDFVYLYAERQSPKSEYDIKERDLNFYSRLGDKTGNMSISYFYECIKESRKISIPSLRHRDVDDDSVLTNVIGWMQYIMDTTLKMSVEPMDDNKRLQLNYKVNIKGSDVDLSPLNVAFGNSYLLPIVLGLLTAPEHSLFIVENPEAHLHPLAQIRVAELISLAAESGVQVVVETHSNEIFTAIRYNIYKRKLGNGKVIAYYRNNLLEDFTKVTYNRNGEYEQDFPDGFFDATLGMLMDMQ